MINVFYRILINEEYNTNYFGFVSARNGHDLFWLIDEFCNPYDVEILKCDDFGICYQAKISNEGEGDFIEPKKKSIQFSDSNFFALNSNAPGWIKPEIKDNEMIIPWNKKRAR